MLLNGKLNFPLIILVGGKLLAIKLSPRTTVTEANF